MEEGRGTPNSGFDEAVNEDLEQIQAMLEESGKECHISLVINHIGTVGNLFQSVGPNARSCRTFPTRTRSHTSGLVSTASQTEDMEDDLNSDMREAKRVKEDGTGDNIVDAAASQETPNPASDGIAADRGGSACRSSPARPSPDAAGLQTASNSAEQQSGQDKPSARKKVQSMIVPGAGAVILWKEKHGVSRPNSTGSEQTPDGATTPLSGAPGGSNENGEAHVLKSAVGRKRRRSEVPEKVLKEIEGGGNVELKLQGVPSAKKGVKCQSKEQVSLISAGATAATPTSPSKCPNMSADAISPKPATAAPQPDHLVPGTAARLSTSEAALSRKSAAAHVPERKDQRNRSQKRVVQTSEPPQWKRFIRVLEVT
ncbi:hypothetical protein KFL_003760060 [Klebsormidium nitens]|uniref:Uncharacterized protein n=1 Tax=Klebsormidium nitens TaxID=105231 RepID=A0A1Y1IB37_KLENI|nr:hypothetical protein KFL_003760060 [Klebsormidium nitens]|eukprot:GAQ87773.1 hypothetical protein KFL_003760060 [Klebsormidium nitens]